MFFVNRKRNWRRWESAALLGLCLCLCTAAWAQAREAALAEGILRLHVVAASDQEEEQALKLRVRDAVLDYLEPRLENAGDAAEAGARIRADLDGLQRAAEAAAEGRSARVSLGKESFPTRNYQGFRLPAGRYESLRVILGEGKGHNWWCVVFPPLCTDALSGERVTSVMSREDLALISEDGVQFRFRLLELWGSLQAALS